MRTVADPLDHVTTYGYDASNNRTSIEDANHRITTFAYDARNRLAGKTYPGGAAYVWKYDADGNQTSIDTPNGRTIATTYDALNRALTTTYSGAGPNEASQTVRHYDGNANVVSVAETIGNDTRTETRRYDAFDRVEHVTDAYGRTVDYRYDAVGNRTHLVDHDGAETVWGYDDLNRNTAITVPGQGTTTQTQTKAGKLASIVRPDGSKSEYAYDDAGRIESIAHTKAGETIASYAYRYDLNGNRIEQKETNGGTTNGEAITAYRYDDADRLDRVTEPERVTNYVLDAVGNRTRETATANGQVVTPMRDQANANLVAMDEQPVGFTGYIKDGESGLYYAKARYYDPAVARFTTEDPEAGKDMEPPSLHRYLYAYANPLYYVDPDGRQNIDSPRYALLQTLNMASNPRDREIAARMLRDYDTAMQARANPEATAAAEFMIETARSILAFAATALASQAEVNMREENGPATRMLRSSLDNAWENATNQPVEKAFAAIHQQSESADAYELAGDDFNARKTRAMQKLEVGTAALDVTGVVRSAVRNVAKLTMRGTALVGAEGANGRAVAKLAEPSIDDDLESAYGPAGKPRTPVVTARSTVDGQLFEDVNQSARVAPNMDRPTLIADRVATKIAKTDMPHPNGSMRTAHAEIGNIQQAWEANATKGNDMVMRVTGEPVCGYCNGDIAAAARAAELNSLTLIEELTGNTCVWHQGMKSIKKGLQ